MKTTDYSGKILRIFIILFLALFIGLILGFGFKDNENITGVIILLTLLSISMGLTMGYADGINTIKNKIISSFGREVKISTKESTVISGKIIVITEGVKVKRIIVDTSSFVVDSLSGEAIENVMAKEKDRFTPLIGDKFISESQSSSAIN